MVNNRESENQETHIAGAPAPQKKKKYPTNGESWACMYGCMYLCIYDMKAAEGLSWRMAMAVLSDSHDDSHNDSHSDSHSDSHNDMKVSFVARVLSIVPTIVVQFLPEQSPCLGGCLLLFGRHRHWRSRHHQARHPWWCSRHWWTLPAPVFIMHACILVIYISDSK